MYLQTAVDLLKFYFSADTRYGVHSPFVFQFVTKVLDDCRTFYAINEIDQLRTELLSRHHAVKIDDRGAGSRLDKQATMPLSKIINRSAITPFWGKILFRTCLLLKPTTIVELGTSAGISAMYLARANSKSSVFTIEGNESIATEAMKNFQLAGLHNINQIVGNFDQKLPQVLQEINTIDLLFVDGHHNLIPTQRYFELSLQKANDHTIFIFDDINWSSEMKTFWRWVKEHPQVTTTIDLFRIGIVFINPDFKQKQHFKLIPYRFKPYQIW